MTAEVEHWHYLEDGTASCLETGEIMPSKDVRQMRANADYYENYIRESFPQLVLPKPTLPE